MSPLQSKYQRKRKDTLGIYSSAGFLFHENASIKILKSLTVETFLLREQYSGRINNIMLKIIMTHQTKKVILWTAFNLNKN